MKKILCFYIFILFSVFSLTQLMGQYRDDSLIFFNKDKIFDFGENTKQILCDDHEANSLASSNQAGSNYSSATNAGTSSLPNITAIWEEIGPTADPINKPNHIGRIDYIAFPNPADNNDVFACSPVGGLFHSIDGGDSWENAGTDKGIPHSGVSCIAFDSQHFDNIWYIATGAAHFSWVMKQGTDGIYRTIDSGDTWVPIGLNEAELDATMPGCPTSSKESIHQINKVIQKPGHPGHLFVATTHGFFETTNALNGTSYAPVIDPIVFAPVIWDHCFDIDIIPGKTQLIITTTGWYCTDKNSNKKLAIYIYDWAVPKSPGINPYKIPDDALLYYESTRASICAEISPASPTKVFLLETDVRTNDAHPQYNSELLLMDLANNNIITRIETVVHSPGDALAVSPKDSNTLWYGSSGKYYEIGDINCGDKDDCQNCGIVKVTNALGTLPLDKYPQGRSKTHADINGITYTADGTQLWVGTDGGVSKYTVATSSWESRNNGLGVATMFNMDIFPSNPFKVIHGDQDCGTNIISKSGDTWNSVHVCDGDSYNCFFDYNDDTHYYYITGAVKEILYESSPHCGIKTQTLGIGKSFAMDVVNPNAIYTTLKEIVINHITYTGLFLNDTTPCYRRYNDLKPWSNFSDVSDQTAGTVAVSKNPSHSNYFYVAWEGGTKDKIFKSTVGGGPVAANWSSITAPVSLTNSAIVVDYYDPNHIWVGFGNGPGSLTYSVNTTTNIWTPIPAAPAWYGSIIQDKENYGLYFSCDYNIFYLENGATGCAKYDGNIPNVCVNDIRINYKTMQIVAGTYGRGAWAAPLVCNPSAADISLTNISSDIYKNALNKITCSGIATSTSHVFLRAGNKIEFLPGFSTAAGCIMNAYVLPCGNIPGGGVAEENYQPDNEKEQEITKPPETENYRIYPNPSSGSVTVELEDVDSESYSTIEVYDMQGRFINRLMVNGSKTGIDFQNKKGVFLIRITANNTVYTSKVLIK